MNVLVILCFTVIHLHTLSGFPPPTESETSTPMHITDNEYENDIKPSDLPVEGRSRTSRKIIRKIHSGISFLVGVKVGSLLANKGFDVGHGSLAASSSFKVFGKSVNSAISLSYGPHGHKLPLLDDPVELNNTLSNQNSKKEDVLHVTVIRNPSEDTIEKLKRIANVSVDQKNQTLNGLVDDDVIIIETKDSKFTNDEKFLQMHNKRVKDFNKDIQRRNSKF